MNVKEIIKKFKLALRAENLVDYKTSDGLVISTDELVVGADVTMVDQEGVEVPATDGEYILEDQTVIVVVEGKISEVKLPEEPLETPEAETPEVEVEVPLAEEAPKSGETMPEAPATDMEELVKRIEKLEAENLEFKQLLIEMAEKNSKEELKQEIKMSKVEKPLKTQDVEKQTIQSNSKLDNIFKNMYK